MVLLPALLYALASAGRAPAALASATPALPAPPKCSLHLTHFDIKASNVLISRAGTAKLADVGFTRAMANTHHSIKDNRVGTFSYVRPPLLPAGMCAVLGRLQRTKTVAACLCASKPGQEPSEAALLPSARRWRRSC